MDDHTDREYHASHMPPRADRDTDTRHFSLTFLLVVCHQTTIFVLYVLFILQHASQKKTTLSMLEKLYIAGFVPLECIKLILSPPAAFPPPLPSISSKLPFLPLLLTSLYAFLGIGFVWTQQLLYYCRCCWSHMHHFSSGKL